MSKKKDNRAAEVEEWMVRLTPGHCYFFQTCTKDWVGKLHSVDGFRSVTLTEASWVAGSGRLHQFVRDGKADNMEIEPVGVVTCQWVNWIPWNHPTFEEAV